MRSRSGTEHGGTPRPLVVSLVASRSHLPMTYIDATLVVGLSASAAGLASFGVHHRVSYNVRRRHQDVGGAVFLQLGVIYAVLLAFVFSETWGEYNTAAQAVNTECADLHGAVLLANDLPDAAGAAFERTVTSYIHTVIDTEWKLMAQRGESLQALIDLRAMLSAARALEADRPRDREVRTQIVNLLINAHEQRETRLFQMNQGIPLILWMLLIAYAVVLVVFVLLAGIEYAISLVIFTSLFCGMTVLILVIIRMLDYPFEGALALQPTDFRNTLLRISLLANAR
jgi:hypothetical protein